MIIQLLPNFGDIKRQYEQPQADTTEPLVGKDGLPDFKAIRSGTVATGFSDYMRNMLHGAGVVFKASFGLDDDDPEVQAVRQRLTNDEGNFRGAAIKDALGSIFSARQFVKMARTAGGQVKEAFAPENIKGTLSDPVALVGGIAMTFASPVGDAIELSTDTQMQDGSFRRLTHEERVRKIKNMVGFGVSMGIATTLHKTAFAPSIIKESRRLGKVLESAQKGTIDWEVFKISNIQQAAMQARVGAKVVSKGKLATELLAKGTVVGAISGTAYAGIAFAGEDDQLTQILMNGVVFAPLGVAMETLGLRGKIKRAGSLKDLHAQNTRLAQEILFLRHMQASENTPIATLTGNVIDAISSDNILEAISKGLIDPDRNALTVFEDVGAGALLNTATLKRKGFLVSESSILSEGAHYPGRRRVLIVPKDSPVTWENRNFFETHGRLMGEKVSVDGQEYYISGYNRNNTKFLIDSPTSNRILEVEPSKIRSLVSLEVRDPIQTLTSGVNARSRIMQEMKMVYGNRLRVFDSYGATQEIPTAQLINSGWENIESDHVGPISMLAFRGEGLRGRTPQSKGAFFSGNLSTALSYLRSQFFHDKRKFNAQEAIDRLTIQRLTFEHPLIVRNGVQSDLLRMWKRDPRIRSTYPELLKAAEGASQNLGAGGGEGFYPIMDSAIARIAIAEGYDGIIYDGGNEIVDFHHQKYIPEASQFKGISLQTIDPSRFIDRLYTGFKNKVFGTSLLKEGTDRRTGIVGEKLEDVKVGVLDEYDLTTRVGEQKGSNEGGFYKTSTNQNVYVKKYGSRLRSMSEAVAGSVYRLFGVKAPKTNMIKSGGSYDFASEIVEGTELVHHKLTKELAREILEGHAVDILLANWDVLGTDATFFDNILIDKDGKAVRIDNGSALFYRGMGEKKPNDVLHKLTEVEGFKTKNPYYNQVIKAAGYTDKEFAAVVVNQIDRILEVERDNGGWGAIVSRILGDNDITNSDFGWDMGDVSDLLDARTQLLREHRNKLVEEHQITARDIPASSLGNFEPPPDFNYAKAITDYIMSLGFGGDDVRAMRNEFERRFHAEMRETMPNETKELIKRAYDAVREIDAIERKTSAAVLAKLAISNDYLLDFHEGGKVELRDTQGNIVHVAESLDAAREFIDKTGQYDGFAISDGGADLPPTFGDLFEPPNPLEEPHHFLANGKWTRFWDTVNTALIPFFTANKDLMSAIDNMMGTRFREKVFNTTQLARRTSNAAQDHWITVLKGIDKLATKYKFDKADRELITHYLSTMTPDEVIASFDPSRQLSKAEILMARMWALGEYPSGEGAPVDLKKVMNVIGLMDQWEKDNKGFASWQWQQEMERHHANLGLNPNEQQAFITARASMITQDPLFKFGNVARLYRALKNNEGGRSKFFENNPSWSKRHKEVADKIEQLYTALDGEFKTGHKRPLTPFLVHAQEYMGGSVGATVEHFGFKKDEFFAKLLGGGDIHPNDFDPIHQAQRYIKAGFDALHFKDVLDKAKADYKIEIDEALKSGRMKPSSEGRTRKIVESYLQDVQGLADTGRMFAEDAFVQLFNSFGWKGEHGTIRKAVNIVSSTGEAAAQGFRVAAAMRDFAGAVIISSMRFGPTRTLEVIKYGIKGLEEMTPTELQKIGIIPASGIVHFADLVEHSSSVLQGSQTRASQIVDAFNQKAFRLSFQKDIYKMFHAGHYLSAYDRTLKALTKFREGKISVREMGESIKLQKYDAPVVRQFLDFVKTGKNDLDAARFLGVQTGFDMVGVYGHANHAMGWNTNVGRLAGQFGQWSVWFKGTFIRELGRGTIRDRVAAAATLFAMQKLMVGAGHALGFNLTNWQPTSGLGFVGGPAVDVVRTVANLAGGSQYMQNEASARLRRYLPYDPVSGKFKVGQIYAPGSFFVQDIVDALTLATEEDPRALGRAFGVAVDKQPEPVLKLPFVGEVIGPSQ